MNKNDVQFKDVVGYEDLLYVSSDGRVFTKDRYVENVNGHVSFLKGKEKIGADNGIGYLQIKVCFENKSKSKYIHRLVAEAFLENPDNLPFVNHKDGNKKNNSVENLEWCTHKDNIAHAFSTGLLKRKHKHNIKEYNCDNCGKSFSRRENNLTKNNKRNFCTKECNLEKFKSNNRKISKKPEKEVLLDLILNNSMLQVGKMFGVSDNSVRKWCKSYDLPSNKEEIKKLKDKVNL